MYQYCKKKQHCSQKRSTNKSLILFRQFSSGVLFFS